MSGLKLNGEAVRAIRERTKLTGKELADRAQISAPYLSRLESGQRTGKNFTVIHAIADALGVPVSAILSIEVRQRDGAA